MKIPKRPTPPKLSQLYEGNGNTILILYFLGWTLAFVFGVFSSSLVFLIVWRGFCVCSI